MQTPYRHLLAALSALLCLSLLMACTDDVPTASSPTAIAFAPYAQAPTRAGYGGSLTVASLKDPSRANGFGVFAYHRVDANYDSSTAPDFMYNEHVRWAGDEATPTMPYEGTVSRLEESRWVYAPIKFWPNQFGSNAQSAHVDRLSFFAYAPHVDVDAATGVPTGDASTGITALTTATATGDPIVSYRLPSNVDLLWAVVPSTPHIDDGGIWIVPDPEEAQQQAEPVVGLPWVDMTKQRVNGTVRLHFLHALAGVRLGEIRGIFDQIDSPHQPYTTYAAYTADDTPYRRAPQTRITVEEISLSSIHSYQSGRLNLNNNIPNTPRWDLAGATTIDNLNYSYTASTLNPWLTDPGDAVFTIDNDLSHKALTETAEDNEHPVGVVHQDLPICSVDGTTPSDVCALILNPVYDGETGLLNTSHKQNIKVSITYYVNTYDTSLLSHWSRVRNHLTHTLTISDQPGQLTTINILVGMTSVKFEASVSEWNDVISKEIHLPKNL